MPVNAVPLTGVATCTSATREPSVRSCAPTALLVAAGRIVRSRSVTLPDVAAPRNVFWPGVVALFASVTFAAPVPWTRSDPSPKV